MQQEPSCSNFCGNAGEDGSVSSYSLILCTQSRSPINCYTICLPRCLNIDLCMQWTECHVSPWVWQCVFFACASQVCPFPISHLPGEYALVCAHASLCCFTYCSILYIIMQVQFRYLDSEQFYIYLKILLHAHYIVNLIITLQQNKNGVWNIYFYWKF